MWLGGCARSHLRDGGPVPDAGRRDAGPLRLDAGGLECMRDVDCDDRASCTTDRCVAGRCETARDLACDGAGFCDLVECAPGTPGADPRTGCVSLGRRECVDEVDCTLDSCDPGARACVFEPDVTRCPLSHRCDPVRGCLARALVHSFAGLGGGGMAGFGEMDLPSGEMHWVGMFDRPLDDVALAGDGTLYGAGTGGGLFTIDYATGTTTAVVEESESVVGLDFSPTGELYGAVPDFVVRIDRATGVQTRVAALPPDVRASGDVAFVEGTLYVTVRPRLGDLPPDDLMQIDEATGAVARVGSIGHACVWGLAPLGGTLYGVTCQGRLIRIDVATGAGELLAEAGLATQFQGAAAR